MRPWMISHAVRNAVMYSFRAVSLRGRESLAPTPIEAATVEMATAAHDAGPKVSAGLGCRLEGRWLQRPREGRHDGEVALRVRQEGAAGSPVGHRSDPDLHRAYLGHQLVGQPVGVRRAR